MIGDKYRIKKDCSVGNLILKKGTILTENKSYNFETEEYEDGKEFNNLFDDKSNFVCEVGSKFASDNLEKIKNEQ